jgi:hypothetical protein
VGPERQVAAIRSAVRISRLRPPLARALSPCTGSSTAPPTASRRIGTPFRRHTCDGCTVRASTGQPGPITTWASAGGKLTLTVPRRSYPLNALARVSLRIQNVSHHDIGYQTPGVSLPGVASPQAQVLDRSGAFSPRPCPSCHPCQALRPHSNPSPASRSSRASTSWCGGSYPCRPALYADLGGERAPGAEHANHPSHHGAADDRTGTTTRPSRDTGGAGGGVIPPAGVTGRPLWLNYADCGDGSSGPTFVYSFGWVGTRSVSRRGARRYTPGICASPGSITRLRPWTIPSPSPSSVRLGQR